MKKFIKTKDAMRPERNTYKEKKEKACFLFYLFTGIPCMCGLDLHKKRNFLIRVTKSSLKTLKKIA